MSRPLLYTQNLTTGYEGRRGRIVSRNIDVQLEAGEFVSLVGPNGTGKSTMLKTLGGIRHPVSGAVYLDGQHVSQLDARSLAREVAVVLAGRVEAGHLSVRKLVALGRYPYTGRFGRLRARDEEVIGWALRTVGGEELAERYVDELSDGEYQRIMIARALAQQPRMVLLDEPAAFLDLMKRVELMHLLKKISRESSASFIVASHDLEMVMAVSDRVWLLDRSGSLNDGAPEDHVLGGSLERVFHSPHVVFDRQIGTFRHVSDINRPRVLLSSGAGTETERRAEGDVSAAEPVDHGAIEERRRWTRRALERMGFRVEEPTEVAGRTESGLRLRVSIVEREGETRWRLDTVRRDAPKQSGVARDRNSDTDTSSRGNEDSRGRFSAEYRSIAALARAIRVV